MPSDAREKLGLSQARVAAWLGIPRATLAQIETGRRGGGASWQQHLRLDLAALGLLPDPSGSVGPAPPPLPLPLPDPDLLGQRLRECRHQLQNLQYDLETLQARAAIYENRFRALAALRAWTGPVPNPAREARWLASFEEEAVAELRDVCGTGPQRLLEARIAGLEREAELLEAFLNELLISPAPTPPPPAG